MNLVGWRLDGTLRLESCCARRHIGFHETGRALEPGAAVLFREKDWAL